MDPTVEHPQKLLLHACCGPCSLEPLRLLRERGIEPAIYFCNGNIQPRAEHDRRLDALREWAQAEGPNQNSKLTNQKRNLVKKLTKDQRH